MPTVQSDTFIQYGRRFAKNKGLFRSGSLRMNYSVYKRNLFVKYRVRKADSLVFGG